MTYSVSPPGTAVWYDLEATTAEVLAVLRLSDTDVDADYIGVLVPVAARLIDLELDRCEAVLGPPPLPELQHALVLQTVDLYQANTPTSTAGFVAPVQISDRVRSLIGPHKTRWGLA